ncbi:MAG: hypothetical protein OXJ54_09545 [Gemmatimonadetes bacterium]|nr:hypothetical protein [Candidatus Palauibacter rhopaloidicola]
MAGRPRLVLLDAGAVFAALEHEAWDALTDRYDVVVPRIVSDEIQFYHSRETHRRVYVDPESWVEDGTIQEYEAQATDVAETLTLINRADGPEIHDGEAEALTYLRLEVDPLASDIAFVSADGAAIQATALLDLSHTAKCLSEVLRAIGYSKPLPLRHRREFVDSHLNRGFQRRMGR